MTKNYLNRAPGFNLLELLVALGILGILAGLLVPMVFSARQRSEDAICISNLHNISQSLAMYVSDNDSYYPAAVPARFENNLAKNTRTWRDVLLPYLHTDTFPHCPVASQPNIVGTNGRKMDICGYAYNTFLNNQVHNKTTDTFVGGLDVLLVYPSSTITLLDARAGMLTMNQPDTGHTKTHGIWLASIPRSEILAQPEGAKRHYEGANYAFADNHVKWLRPEQIKQGKHGDGIHPSFGL